MYLRLSLQQHARRMYIPSPVSDIMIHIRSHDNNLGRVDRGYRSIPYTPYVLCSGSWKLSLEA